MQGDPPNKGGEPDPGGQWLPPEPPGTKAPVGPHGPDGTQAPDSSRSPGPQFPGAPPPSSQPGPPPPSSQPGPTPPAYGSPPAGYAPPPYAQPGATGWGQPQQPEAGNGPAVAALVLGIVSIVTTLFLGIFLVTLPVALICGITAIVLGRNGKRKVDSGATRKHRGLAQAGFITGIVGVVLAILGIVGFILLITLSEEFQEGFDEGFDQSTGQGLDRSSAGLIAVRVAGPLLRALAG